MTNSLRDRKTVLRKISSGLYIVTGIAQDRPTAAVISFLTQTSINPPLITLAIRENSRLYGASGNGFGIHFPAVNQKAMVASFFKLKNVTDHQLNGYPYQLSKTGVPLLDDIPMIAVVEVREIIPRGDHHIFITEVVETILREEVSILAMPDTSWHYGG